MRLFGLVLAVALIGGCKSGGKDPADDTDETDTVPADDTDETDTVPVDDTDGDTDPIDTPDDTDDTDDTDPPIDTDTPGGDTNDTAPVDTFNPDTTFVPDPETGDSGGGPGPGETGETGDTGSTPPSPCDPFEQLDCDGECFPITLLGDGVCHDGFLGGTPNFDCEDLGFDDGDCLGDTDDDPCPDPLDVRDCASRCYPLAWVGDGQCDDGTVYPHGDPNFECPLFSFDDGDCAIGP